MKSMSSLARLWVFFLVMPFVFSCGSSSDDTADDDTPAEETGLAFASAADFSASAAASLSAKLAFETTGTCDDLTDLTMDNPILTDGLDCDGDGGVVAHVTPTEYAIAFKRITLLADDADTVDVDFVADTGTLAESELVSFTESDSSETLITIDPADLAAGTYSGVEAELYYFQMTFPISGTESTVRIYMSDDDFAAEGSLGHHQGDITLIDTDGTELGWIDYTWAPAGVSATRGEAQNGAGGTDAETGHDRGFFGNADLWDNADFAQGADQDIFTTVLDFDEPLEIPDPTTITTLTTITATFSVADAFYYENFAPTEGGFSPAAGGEAASEDAEWAPLTPAASIAVE